MQSYYHREIYTACYVLAASWPVFQGLDFVGKNWLLCGTWAVGCSAMSVFTLLPANKIENDNLILLGGTLILTLGVLYIALEESLLKAVAPAHGSNGLSRAITGVQVGLVALAIFVTRSSVASLQAKQGLPRGTQLVGWSTLGQSTFPFHSCTPYPQHIAYCILSTPHGRIAINSPEGHPQHHDVHQDHLLSQNHLHESTRR